jgi:outer membrane lipoprotein carrier protein
MIRRVALAIALSPFAALAQPAGAPTPKAPEVAPAAAPTDVHAVVAGIQAFYADAQDLKADFVQAYTYKVYDRTQKSTGKVFFKKKNLMRWDYQTPESKVFVADGATLWVYEPEQGQVYKRGLKSAQLPVALTFMSGEGKLAEAFDATLLAAPTPSTLLVELIPKTDLGDYQSLRLEVDKTTFAVVASTVIDPVGNTNRVVFSGVETNSGLPDAGFKFTPPAGVRVLTEPAR